MVSLDDRVREILEEAYKRLIPAAAYLVSPAAGFAATTWIFFTWLLSRSREWSSRGRDLLSVSEDRLVELRYEIDRVRRMIGVKRRALERTDDLGRDALEREISVLEEELKRLEELYGIETLRYLAWRVIERTGDRRLIDYLRRFEEKLGRGEIPSKEQLEILRRLEEYRRRGELRETVIRRMLESIYGGDFSQ